jgi:hypothetical protein
MLSERPRRADAGIQGWRPAGAAGEDSKIRRGIYRSAVHNHPKVQVRAVGQAGAPNGRDPFSAVDRLPALRQHRGDKPEVTVNANEPFVLDQNLEASDSMVLNPDDAPWRNCGYRATDRRRKIDPIMKSSRQWFVRQDAGPERRRNAR